MLKANHAAFVLSFILLMAVSLTHLSGPPVGAAGLVPVSLPRQGATAARPNGAARPAPASPSAPAAVCTVNSLEDAGAGAGAAGDLRYCLTRANAAGGSNTINFTVTGVINLTAPLPDITNNLTINGPGPADLTVRRDGGWAYRIFTIPLTGLNVVMTGLTIRDGHAANDFGGGILSSSPLTLTDCLITQNEADFGGGGLALQTGNGTFTGCTISGNAAGQGGGGIFYEGDGDYTLTLTNCTISGNTANGNGQGAGIFNASFSGGSMLQITNCTIAYNVSTQPNGGGIFTTAQGSGNAASTRLRNAILAFNTEPNLNIAGVGGGAASVTSQGYNLATDSPSFLDQPTDLLTTNPVIAPLGDYGGPTPTHLLLLGSPAIDHGAAVAGVTTDQRGMARPQDDPTVANAAGGDGSDIGAAERLAGMVVSNSDSVGAGSLRQAILNANAEFGDDVITFNLPAGPQTINLLQALPDITDSVHFYNHTGAANLTLRRTVANSFRIFTIPVAGKIIQMTGLTIRDGLAGPGEFGGGISSSSSLFLKDCVVANNSADAGGGIYLNQTGGHFEGGAIINNVAITSGGGGIYYIGKNGYALDLDNCTISGNAANGTGYGGGVLYLSSQSTSMLQFLNCTIAENMSANSNGGGITITAGGSGNTASAGMFNTLVAGNTAPNLKGVSLAGGNPNLYSQGYNLASDGGGGFLTQPTDLINVDPLLAPLASYGGPTPTHALLPGSPAINRGFDATNSETLDQRGILRMGLADIGAFESRGFVLAVAGGNNQSTLVTTAFAAPLTVTVSSTFGEPVNGGLIAFISPSAGPSAALAPIQATINAGGQASTLATANGVAGSYPVMASASGGNSVNFTLTNIQCPVIAISPSNSVLPTGVAGQMYNQTFTQTGGNGAVSYSLGSGALPSGLTLSSAGSLSGAPTAFGTFNFSVRAMDALGCTGGQSYTLTIAPPCGAITINPTGPGLPNGFVGTAYNLTFTQTGGAGPIIWSIRAGSLPDGLSLDGNTGAITGTPTLAATVNFTLQAADANNCTGTRVYSLAVGGSGLMFYPLTHPVRLLDTRAGASGCFTPNAAIPGGTSRTQPARGACDGLTIPANAAAITGNITTVQSGGGYLTLYPSDAAQPLVANSNYNPNEILNNVFTVGLGNSDGAFKIFALNTTDVVVDVTGYYAPPETGGLYFHPLPKPIRLLDTRSGASGCTTPNAPLAGNAETVQTARLTCDGVTIPAGARAIVGNATTVNPQGPGFPYLTLFPADAARPLVASSNYLPGQVMNAPFTVGLSATGEFKMYVTTQTELVVDVLGYYSAEPTDANGTGLLFNPLPAPVRLLDTRVGALGCSTPEMPLQAGSTMNLWARINCNGSPIANTALAIVGNATVVNTAGGYLTFWPSTAAQPLVATSNFTAGQVFNRHFTVGLGAGDGAFKIFTQLQTDLVVDVAGFFAP